MARWASVIFDATRRFAHVRYQAVVLETPEDVAGWAAEIDAGFARIGRKVDIIIDLGELVVRPGAIQAYDDARLGMFERHALSAYRYRGSALVRTKILTSSTIHKQTANVFETFEQLLADRAKR